MKVVIRLLVLVVVCYAQLPERCDSPKQWYGVRVLVDSSKDFAEKARFFYDEVNKRVRIVEEIEQGRERDFFDVLRLHNEGKEYRVNLHTKKCNVTKLTFPFRPVGVPEGAKFMFESEIGAAQVPLEHLTIVAFGGEYPEDHVRYLSMVTFPDCVPIGDNYYNDVTKYVESRYFDVNITTLDPMHFKIPDLCTE